MSYCPIKITENIQKSTRNKRDLEGYFHLGICTIQWKGKDHWRNLINGCCGKRKEKWAGEKEKEGSVCVTSSSCIVYEVNAQLSFTFFFFFFYVVEIFLI